MEKRIELGARSVVVWAPEGACGRVPLVVMPVFRGDGSKVWRRCRELECPAFSLVSIGGVTWERDMTPWAAEPATRREAAYEGGAPAFLAELLDEVLLQAVETAAEQVTETKEKNIVLELTYEAGNWWVVPGSELRDLLSGALDEG